VQVLDQIYQTALASPDKTALVYNLSPISYRDFHQRITAMRRQLAELGLRPGGVAVVWVDNILASWVLNLALRGDGFRTMSVRTAAEIDGAADLDVVGVFTLEAERKRVDGAILPGAARFMLTIPTPAAGEPLAPPPTTEAGGHILLTSGTTGDYKMVPFEGAFEAAIAKIAEGQLATRPAMIALFDFGLWTMMGYAGPTAVWSLGETAVIHDQAELWRILTVEGLTQAALTPAQLAQLMAAPEGAFPRNDGMELRIVAGALSEPLYRRTVDRLTSRIITNLGSTEGGGLAQTEIKSAEDLRWHRLSPDAKFEIVDENDHPVPAGQVGQIRVPQVEGVSGYVNDADATASAFRDGFFYPGDLAMMDEQGRIALLGRVTDVVALGGDKLPAGPLEAALTDALGCDVCLLSEQGPDKGEDLHVVVETAHPIDQARLTAVAKTHLAKFPAIHFHVLPRLPRNHMGKVERFRLRQTLIARAAAKPTG